MTLRNISPKKLAKLGGRVPSSSITGTRKPIRKKPRKPSETLRIYGPPARRAWMRTLPCSACGVVGYSEGAHVLGNGGTGRKADYQTQAPLCGIRFGTPTIIGCHITYDRHRSIFDAAFPDFDPAKVAADTQARWLAIADKPGRGPTTKGSEVK